MILSWFCVQEASLFLCQLYIKTVNFVVSRLLHIWFFSKITPLMIGIQNIKLFSCSLTHGRQEAECSEWASGWTLYRNKTKNMGVQWQKVVLLCFHAFLAYVTYSVTWGEGRGSSALSPSSRAYVGRAHGACSEGLCAGTSLTLTYHSSFI
jgi:hypothetical protein